MHRPTKQERIGKYVAATPGAIFDTGGHNQTFKAACALYNDWELSEAETRTGSRYNAMCQPPWSENELKHKTNQAAKAVAHRPFLCVSLHFE
jgi:hypothetical protein